jgi:hypothetical protein
VDLFRKQNPANQTCTELQGLSVPETGFEPAQPFGCCHLKTVRLPISPPGQLKAGCKFIRFNLTGETFFRYGNITDYRHLYYSILKYLPGVKFTRIIVDYYQKKGEKDWEIQGVRTFIKNERAG